MSPPSPVAVYLFWPEKLENIPKCMFSTYKSNQSIERLFVIDRLIIILFITFFRLINNSVKNIGMILFIRVEGSLSPPLIKILKKERITTSKVHRPLPGGVCEAPIKNPQNKIEGGVIQTTREVYFYNQAIAYTPSKSYFYHTSVKFIGRMASLLDNPLMYLRGV